MHYCFASWKGGSLSSSAPVITRHRRILRAGMLVSLWAMILTLLMPSNALAAMSCRADPIVTLSNGKVVQMISFMETDPANVRGIVYTLRAPAGTTVKNIAYTGGALAGKEKVVFIADRAAGVYVSETVITTTTSGVRVSAQTRIGGASALISGLSGQRLVANFRVQ